ncbi:radical SAM protein [Desulfuromonas acetoxidans]|uniref:radical SAM protein n=1 Tax=Desulfuromonas acetoxidans TaxID=891 RepID=UPI002930D3F2|nr:radical SAM protein [Desulfuromonas acetoxidans]
MYYFLDYEEPLFRPPSEGRSLILQATIGCSQNQCRFCGMYKMKQFRIRSVDELADDLRCLPLEMRQTVQRVFLADGDALIYPFDGLIEVLDLLQRELPALTRVSSYASPKSLVSKSPEELRQLRSKKLRILYFGLESGDDETLRLANKGYDAETMRDQALKARQAGMKLSVTAILGLAGRQRSHEHAVATAAWVNAVSPEYFSLLTMFHRHNEAFYRSIEPLSHGEILQETVEMLEHLHPQRTILRSNHVSNFLNLAGSYPKDRQALLDTARQALERGRQNTRWFEEIPAYHEQMY